MRLRKENRWVFICVLLTCLLVILSKTVFFLGYIPTESMEPTLKKDSLILATRLYASRKIEPHCLRKHNSNLPVRPAYCHSAQRFHRRTPQSV